MSLTSASVAPTNLVAHGKRATRTGPAAASPVGGRAYKPRIGDPGYSTVRAVSRIVGLTWKTPTQRSPQSLSLVRRVVIQSGGSRPLRLPICS